MAFGAEIYNSKGYRVFDGLDCMYVKSTGVCNKLPGVNQNYLCYPEGGTNSVNPVARWIYIGLGSPANGWPADVNQVVGNLRSFTAWWNNATYYSTDGIFDFSDMPFVQVPAEGILSMGIICNRLPEFAAAASMHVVTRSPTALPYMIFSPTMPTTVEPYGMQLFNEAGQVVFDSRKRILGLDFFSISAATMQDILVNNSVVDLTLSKATPGAYVSSPEWLSYTGHSTTSGCGSWVKITQPNSTTIRLSRQRYGKNTGLCDNAYHGYYPAQLFVTRAS